MDRRQSDPEVRIELAEMRTQQEWRYRIIASNLAELSEDVRLLVHMASEQSRRPSQSFPTISGETLVKLLPYIVGPAILLVVYVLTGSTETALKASGIAH